MASIKWYADRASQPISIMTTELNSLANNAAALSAAVANTTEADLYGSFELVVTYGTGPTANTTVDMYFVRQIDGTNYEDASTTGPILPKNGYAGSFVLRNVTTQQRMIVPHVTLPSRTFKVMLVNNGTGQSMAASGNTLKMYAYKQAVS